jgi:hypothetical protein
MDAEYNKASVKTILSGKLELGRPTGVLIHEDLLVNHLLFSQVVYCRYTFYILFYTLLPRLWLNWPLDVSS